MLRDVNPPHVADQHCVAAELRHPYRKRLPSSFHADSLYNRLAGHRFPLRSEAASATQTVVCQSQMTPNAAKANSESFLREHGIEINPTLPIIETLDELTPQTASAVATRSVVLSYVIGLGFGGTGSQIKPALAEHGLLDALSANERALIDSDAISEQDKINCTWLTECAQSLGYCLGLVDLDPFRPCDDDLASNFPDPFTDPTPFIQSASLRSFDDIYLQADLHYRIHWAARNARLVGTDCPITEGFIRERRKPLDWVIGVEDDWDEIPMDT